ncbi:MAG: NAD(P)H-dependent oxidoreductase [Methanomicrobiales archaeon]|nr:NAD(P)H-dependent oxidoreductase [Methanomicrobiales archaeon]
MKTLVAFYSWQGHTGKVAKALATRTGADLVQIEAEKESGMFGKATGAMLGRAAPIRPCKTDLSGVDFLVLASPVWAGKVPPYVNRYIELLSNTSGKPFSLVAEMGKSGAEKAIAHMRKRLEAKGMQFVSSAATLESEVDMGSFMPKIEELAKTIVAK